MNQPNISTYPPGTPLTVGSHQCKVLKYITSGGYAQVYSAEMYPNQGYAESNVACLKRVIVPDKPSLNTLRAEVDAMKLLKNTKHVVSYIDSHAAKSTLQNGSYEVFLLMEYCAGGGLIDFMNTRLQNRLQEFEILNIMSQVTQGIAAMHALVPPLIHRDIKIENILISHRNEYKVCDFGSVCGVLRPPKNTQELAYVQHDIMKSTTAQYRAPEMIDLYRGFPIDEKSDIWAMGVFLYKLCYYTTPFEKGGELAILHSKYVFPAQPIYSDRLKHLIQSMLMESPIQRPNVCQVLEEVSRIQGIPCPIKNFYLLRAMEQTNLNKNLQNYQPHVSKTQSVLAISPTPVIDSCLINDITNMQPLDSIPQQIQQMQQMQQMQQIQQSTTSNTLPTFIPATPINKSPVNSHVNGFHNNMQAIKGTSVESTPMPSLQKLKSAPSESNIRSTSPKRGGRGKINQIVHANPTAPHRRTLYVDSETQTFDPSISLESFSDLGNSRSISSFTSLPVYKQSSLNGASSFKESSATSKPNSKVVTRSTSPKALDINELEDIVKERPKSSSPNQFSPYLSQISQEHLSTKNEADITHKKSSKHAIQKRVHDLLNSPNDPLKLKDLKNVELAETAHNNKIEQPNITDLRKSKSKPPPLPPKPAHLRPKKPHKPAYLSGDKVDKQEHVAVLDSRVEHLTKNVRKKVPSAL